MFILQQGIIGSVTHGALTLSLYIYYIYIHIYIGVGVYTYMCGREKHVAPPPHPLPPHALPDHNTCVSTDGAEEATGECLGEFLD